MNGFRNLIRESGRFYLAVLAIVLFWVICDSVSICRNMDIAFTGKQTERLIAEKMEREMERQNAEDALLLIGQGKSTEYVFENRATEIGLMLTAFAIFIILAVKEFYYMDIRAEEFRRTLPLKAGSRILHGYFAMLGILLLGMLVQGAILFVSQNHYNETAAAIAGEAAVGKAGWDSTAAMVSANGKRLLAFMGIYFLIILLVYTWIYLGMMLAKNPVAGGVLSFVIWVGICGIQEEVAYYGESVFSGWVCRLLYRIPVFSPGLIFWGLDIEGGTVGDGRSLNAVLAGIGAVLILMAALLFVIAGKRELSSGKLFYFPLVDYLFSFACGIIIYMYLTNGIFYHGRELARIAALAAAVVIWWLIHPHADKRAEIWEVK